VLRRNYARLASLGTAITPTSAASRATILTAEELHVSVPYARMQICLKANTGPTRTPTAETLSKWLEEPWAVTWPTRIGKYYASTRKSLINDVHKNELKFQSSKGKEKKILLDQTRSQAI
jgi:hypothetical protein